MVQTILAEMYHIENDLYHVARPGCFDIQAGNVVVGKDQRLAYVLHPTPRLVSAS